MYRPTALLLAMSALASQAQAETLSYTLDPNHTFPSFEADHMGLSLWRGKFNRSKGKATLDRAAGTGTLEVTIDLASVDFGLDAMNKWARGKDFFDSKRYPAATYKGRFADFREGAPTKVAGELTLHGVTRPVELTMNGFKCIPHPMLKREYCGTDATASFNRADFGLDMGKDYGFRMEVMLRIQAEAVADK
ncbi:YceI family protein [Rubrivivax sp. A210]|uniref:YceI family protein n=1 Tax=Rubrivivax sp. A210 TaxID=2772301 RepID=UPI001919EE36|nr:YceI family protein [Rubrivivax sp. A210]